MQNGANSAVGRYVIQLAHHRGIKTVNVVRDRPNYEELERELLALGATTVVKADKFALPETQSYLESLLGGKRPILGLNCVSGLATSEMSNFLANGSTLVTYGGMGGKNPTISAASLIFRDIRYVGFWMTRWTLQPENSEKRWPMFAELASLFKAGVLKPPRVEEMKLDNWKTAFARYANP